MAKRIVSGIFILTALGALGVILAGAMTSGEQLIVRFLTAVTVAALALYVISDLRLQNEQEEPPADRTGSAPMSTRQSATAVMATVTGSHRISRPDRRSRVESPQAAPNFEAIQPVTAPPRAVSTVDPTETVTGSRLVPPSPGSTERTVPPHPATEHLLVKSTPTGGPLAVPMVPVRPSAQDPTDETPEPHVPVPPDGWASEGSTPDDSSPEDWAPATTSGSAIAATSYSYSGPLDSVGVEWPPKPPEGGTDEESVDAGDPTPERRAVDTPTAELPALEDLSAFDTSAGSLLTMFTPQFDGTDRAGETGAETFAARPYLFAVDTSELTPAASSEQTETLDSTDSGTPTGPMETVETTESESADTAEDENQSAETAQNESADTAEAAENETLDTTDNETLDTGEEATVAEGEIGDHTEPTDATGSTADFGGIMDTPSEDDPLPTLSTPASRRIEAAHYVAPSRTEVIDLRNVADPTGPIDSSRAVAAPTPNDTNPPDKLSAAIKSGELQVVNSLINQGMLSTSGPITDRDVRTMVYVAFTSNELRKLILAGGTPDGIRAGDLDLGEVELFDESRFAPPPKRLYAGPPTGQSGGPEPILDLVALDEDPVAPPTPDSPADHATEDNAGIPSTPPLPTPAYLYRRADIDNRIDR